MKGGHRDSYFGLKNFQMLERRVYGKLPMLSNTQNRKNLFSKKNSENKQKFVEKDPWEKIQGFSRLLKWINESFEYQRYFLKKFVLPFSICVFMNLLKGGFFCEAKFFLKKINIDSGKGFDYFRKKNLVAVEPKLLNIRKVSRLIGKKIFRLRIPEFILQGLKKFLEKDQNNFFLACLNEKFHVENQKTFLNLEKRDPEAKKKKLILQNNFKEVRTGILLEDEKNLMKKPSSPKSLLDGFKILKITTEKNLLPNCATLSKKEETIAVGFQDSSVKVFDLKQKEKSKFKFTLYGHKKSVFSTEISSCGNFIISGCLNGEIFLWSLGSKKILRKYPTQKDPIWGLKFSKENRLFLSCSQDSTSSLWALERTFPLRMFIGHGGDVNEVKWHPTGSFFATGSDDNTVGLWDIRIGKRVGSIKTIDKSVQSLDFSPGGNEVSFSGLSRFIDTWDLRADKLFRRIKETHQTLKINNVSYSEKGNFFGYIQNQKLLRIWAKKNSLENVSKTNSSNLFFQKQTIETQVNRILKFEFSQKCKGVLIGTNN